MLLSLLDLSDRLRRRQPSTLSKLLATSEGGTLLHVCVLTGNMAVLQALADTNLTVPMRRNRQGMTAAQLARVMYGSVPPALAELLDTIGKNTGEYQAEPASSGTGQDRSANVTHS